jgi:dsDNA-specific endonuclease/ATPase MutS2
MLNVKHPEQRTTNQEQRPTTTDHRSTNHEQRTTNNDQRTTIDSHHDNPFPEPVEIEITDSLDLHAFSPKDVKAVTIAYLEEARAKGFRIVRIIHGKGIGVQREIVRSVLKETDFVEGFKSGDGFGGEGSTVVKFVS